MATVQTQPLLTAQLNVTHSQCTVTLLIGIPRIELHA